MRLREILQQKGRSVVGIGADRTVLEAARTLVEHGIGSLVVQDDGHLLGIITERDILRLTARSVPLEETLVRTAMTVDVVTTTPDAELQATMTTMTERRIRHLPVLSEDGGLEGLVSIGDLLNACRVEAEAENTHLREYIQGAG
ncbi:MAG: CBS domain-containing protein [Longimicrobiales bacterium]